MRQDFNMIQNFDVKGGPEFGQRNLPKLRTALADLKLDGFLIPHADEYQNEYLPACNERLMWATGFTGSAGAAAILGETAAIFVDGRYTLQVRAQVDEALFQYAKLENNGMTQWLSENVKEDQTIGFDPKLFTPDNLAKIHRSVTAKGGKLKALQTNPIDTAWEDRPAAPLAPVTIQPLELAGKPHSEKRKLIAAKIKSLGADAALITSPASIAWLLNIRGADVMCTPLSLIHI